MLLRTGEQLIDRLHEEGVHPALAFFVESVERGYTLGVNGGLIQLWLTVEEQHELSTEDFILKPHFFLTPNLPHEMDTSMRLTGTTYLAIMQGRE